MQHPVVGELLTLVAAYLHNVEAMAIVSSQVVAGTLHLHCLHVHGAVRSLFLQVSASVVKELRDKTGAGMMDCKKALAENNNDIEASIEVRVWCCLSLFYKNPQQCV
jgi:hypothetical protein